MMFTVALYLPWCKYLVERDRVQPQLYADILKCVSRIPEALLDAARFTNENVLMVGQENAPAKGVLISTSNATRADMKNWILSELGDKWTVTVDGRGLGGH